MKGNLFKTLLAGVFVVVQILIVLGVFHFVIDKTTTLIVALLILLYVNQGYTLSTVSVHMMAIDQINLNRWMELARHLNHPSTKEYEAEVIASGEERSKLLAKYYVGLVGVSIISTICVVNIVMIVL